jgi:hypothetical protein
MALLNPLRIALSDPLSTSGENPRFVVANQAGTSSGDVKMYSWDREVSLLFEMYEHAMIVLVSSCVISILYRKVHRM